MLSRKADGPLTVQIPGPAEDRPSWTKVGVIAAIGFLVGVAWPRLAGSASVRACRGGHGVRRGRRVPLPRRPRRPRRPSRRLRSRPSQRCRAAVPAPTASVAAPAIGHRRATASSSRARRPTATRSRAATAAPFPGSTASSCRGCASSRSAPRRRAPAASCTSCCTSTSRAAGSASTSGAGHGVSSPDALLACAKSAVGGAGLGPVVHDNPRYSVAYSVTFAGGEGGGAPSAQRLGGVGPRERRRSVGGGGAGGLGGRHRARRSQDGEGRGASPARRRAPRRLRSRTAGTR